MTTTFTYSPQRRWLTRITTTKGTTVLLDNQYTRNKTGRITAITGLTANDNWTYAYDDLGRLTSASNAGNSALSETFSYAPNGNLLTRTRVAGTYVYPDTTAARPHAATQIGNKTLSYDANGNLLSDGSRSLVWNGANQLSSVTRDNATVALTYGPDGTRAIKSWPFGKTLYPSADIEIDANTPGSEVFT